jgi:hypothetical protein
MGEETPPARRTRDSAELLRGCGDCTLGAGDFFHGLLAGASRRVESRTTMANGITRVSTTSELWERRPATPTATYLDIRDWADCFIITNGRHDRLGRDVEHFYEAARQVAGLSSLIR